MSTSVVTGAIGAGIGFAIGGPQGAYYGWALGSAAGNIIDPQVIRGPSIGDIAQQTSQEGGPIPIVFGLSPPMTGNVIATSEPRIVKKKQGGKGGPKVVVPTVFRTYAIGICEGPIGGVLRVWRNNTKVYDALDPEFTTETLGPGFLPETLPSRNDTFLENARFFLGAYDQDASPDLEAVFGAGTTPSYRGLAYMVMADEDVTDTRGMVPQWTFQVGSVVTEETPPMGILSIGAQTAAISYDREGHGLVRTSIPNEANRQLYRAPQQESTEYALYYSVTYSTSVLGVRRVKVYPDGTIDWGSSTSFTSASMGFSSGDVFFEGGCMGIGRPNFLIAMLRLDATLGSSTRQAIVWIDPETGISDSCIVANGFNSPFIGTTSGNAQTWIATNGDVYWGLAQRTVASVANTPSLYHLNIFDNAGSTNATPDVVVVGAPGTLANTLTRTLVQMEGRAVWMRTSTATERYAKAFPEAGTIFTPGTAVDGAYCDSVNGTVIIAIQDNALSAPDKWRYYKLVGSSPVLLYNPQTGSPANAFAILPDRVVFQFTAPASQYQYVTIDLETGDVLADEVIAQPFTDAAWGNSTVSQVWPIIFPFSADPVVQAAWAEIPPKLPAVVSAIALRAGIGEDYVDVSQLPESDVRGIAITNQYPAAQAIQALGQVYKFDATKYDGKIRFIPRGGNSVATITEADMVDDDSEIEESKRSDSIQIPRVLHLNYHDADTDGLTPIKQVSERAGDRRAVGELSMQSAVVMEADLAAQTVNIAHAVMIEDQKGELRFGLSDKHIGLVPSDPIIVQWNGKSERARIHQVDILDGYQSYICLRDRQSSYTSEVEGIPPPVVPTPPSRVVGPTAIMPLDIPILRDADDNVGLTYYVAISGLTEAWAGAVVELSYDGGANYIDSREAPVGAVMGQLVTALPDHPADYPDGTNEFTVQLYSPTDELLDSTLEGMLNRANLAAIGSPDDGWELINFAGVTQDSSGDWVLSNLLRGRKDTATQAHAIGAMFVLLDRNVLGFEPASITDIGRTMTFRATSAGQPTDTGTVVAMVYAGKSQTERHAAYLEATRDGDDLEVTWQGVGRLGGGGAAIHGAFFTGYRVTFDDGADQIVVDTLAEAITQDVSALSSPVTVSVQQMNSLTGAGPSIEVIVA